MSLIEGEIENFKQSLAESEQLKAEKRMKETVDSVMMKVEINQ